MSWAGSPVSLGLRFCDSMSKTKWNSIPTHSPGSFSQSASSSKLSLSIQTKTLGSPLKSPLSVCPLPFPSYMVIIHSMFYILPQFHGFLSLKQFPTLLFILPTITSSLLTSRTLGVSLPFISLYNDYGKKLLPLILYVGLEIELDPTKNRLKFCANFLGILSELIHTYHPDGMANIVVISLRPVSGIKIKCLLRN